ncbi:MAG: S1/P1 nuclease [Candidatus Euphemobacter frigidus]|nr:S1/P1 nuclease [Candidatus Euphemobacter frigidus]
MPKFLVHFMGDLHQPLHCGKAEDRGGNDVPVSWQNQETNLHAIWDSLIFRERTGTVTTWARCLQAELTPGERAAIMKGRPYDWMVESHLIARDFCYARLPRSASSFREAKNPELSGAYAREAQPIGRRRVVEAGLRLAKVLNEIFSSGPAGAQVK